jgi:hypothetical protein
MPDKIITRMGDGARVEMSAEQVKEDILVGTQDAAERGKIPERNCATAIHLSNWSNWAGRMCMTTPEKKLKKVWPARRKSHCRMT